MTAIVSVQNSFNNIQKHDIPHPAVSYLVVGICWDKSTSQLNGFWMTQQLSFDDLFTCLAPGNPFFCHPCNQSRSGLDDFSSSSCFFGEQKLSSDVDGSSSSFLKFRHSVAPSPSLQLVRWALECVTQEFELFHKLYTSEAISELANNRTSSNQKPGSNLKAGVSNVH